MTLHAAGRTDAGVHALAMTAHVDIDKADHRRFRLADGTQRQAAAAAGRDPRAPRRSPDDFHARFSCIGRRYLYRIVNRRAPLALEAGRAWRVPVVLDADDDARGGAGAGRPARFHHLPLGPLPVGQPGQDARPADRAARWARRSRSRRRRAPSSTTRCARWSAACELVGRGKWTKADLKAALEARDRAALGFNAPPDGLYFVEALYPDER